MTTVREQFGSGSFEMDLSLFDDVIEQLPYSAGYNLRTAFGRIGAEFRKTLAQRQRNAGMRRFVRKGSYQASTPVVGRFSTVKRFIRSRGLESISAAVFFTSDEAVLFEEGGEIRREGLGLPIRWKRAARGNKFKDRPGGRTLARVAAASQSPLVWIKDRESGLWTVYERKGVGRPRRAGDRRLRRRRRKDRLLPVVTFHPEVSFQKQLGFVETVQAIEPQINEHLGWALNETVKRMEKLRDRGVI